MTDSGATPTHEPDTSRPLPGVTPEQRLIDLAEKTTLHALDTPWGWIVEGKAFDRYELDLIAACSPQTIKALAEVVRAAREAICGRCHERLDGPDSVFPCDEAVHIAYAALDSQEEQQS